MRNRANRWWILAYLVGVGVFSSGVSVACTFLNYGDFKEHPSPYYGAWEDAECMSEWGVPRCGFYMCTSSACGSYSHVQGCTTATPHEMFQYMQMGCRSEACGMY